METWIIWAIAGALFGGAFNFCYKIIAQRRYDTYIVTMYSYTIAFLLSLILYLYRGDYELQLSNNLVIFGIAFCNILFFYLSVISRIESLRNIDTVIFYPLYKTFGPIVVTFISLFYFRESLNLSEVFGILVGISIPLLLINVNEKKIQKNLLRGLIFLGITVLWGSISPIFPKLANILKVNMDAFITYTFFLGIIFSYFGYLIHHRGDKKAYETDGIVKFSLMAGVIQFFTFYTYNMSMSGNLAVAFTINSFSILIPIILSIIFYGEHFNLKKGIVIALSIVSILLFI